MNLLLPKRYIILMLVILGDKNIIAANVSDSIYFKLELDDTSKFQKPGKIIVEYMTDHSRFFYFQEKKVFEFYLNHGKEVNFAVPHNQIFSYFIIRYYSPDGAVAIPFHGDKWYLVMHEEEVHATISMGGIFFKGKYAAYFNCQRDIQDLYKPLPRHVLLTRQKKQDEYLLGLKEYKDSVYLQQKLILEKHQQLFNDTAFKIIDLSCRAKAYFNVLYEMRYNRQGRWNAARQIVNEYLGPRDLSSDLLVSVPYYCDYLLLREYMNISYNNERAVEARFHYTKTYDSINTYYSGLLREKLICLFYLYDTRLKGLISDRLSHSFSIVRSPRYGTMLKQISTSILTGIPAYPFELEDTTGQVIKLSDFKNKLLVLDFWFKGCKPCMDLAKAMIPIKEKYKDDTNVVFININVDEDKTKWISALSNGIYSSAKNEFNLYTNGYGIYHPFIKYYNFFGFPHQIVVDREGKVAVIDPPRPISEENKILFIQLIESHLRQISLQP
jgi:Thiol-disulfide isomerase and thioredoxins